MSNGTAPGPVLVTGASSGIGLYTTRLLAERGVPVYATVRREVDAERLAAFSGVEPVICDVRDDADVAALRSLIGERGNGLWGLVNNAGIVNAGSLATGSVEDMQDLFDVNVLGVHRVTRAVVDLLLASGGRIVNMSSISGTLSPAEIGIYSMSKHALEAYTDALWAELRERGVHVSAVQPGNFQSEIVANMVKRVPRPAGSSEWVQRFYEPGADISRGHFPPPDTVAEACFHALFDPHPHRRYLITPDENEALVTLKKAAMELLQMNRASSHRQTHERLHALLDEVAALMQEQEAPSLAAQA
jgi:NAD(P)-dependent dehydrogenase (short-subunit alcohol dehydrogenase family)